MRLKRNGRHANPRRQPLQEVIAAALNAGIEEDSALDAQFQSVAKTEEMEPGLIVAGPAAKELE